MLPLLLAEATSAVVVARVVTPAVVGVAALPRVRYGSRVVVLLLIMD